MAKQKLSRAEKKAKKSAMLRDPLGIQVMPDEDFLKELPNLKRKAIGQGLGCGFIFTIVVVMLVILWDFIFYK